MEGGRKEWKRRSQAVQEAYGEDRSTVLYSDSVARTKFILAVITVLCGRMVG